MNKTVRNLWRSGVIVAAVMSLTPALARADQAFDGQPSASSSKVRLAPPGLGVPDHYIVVLDETRVRFGDQLEKVGLPTPAQVGQVLVARHGGRMLKTWSHILPALYVELSAAAVTRMSGDGVVRYLEQVTVATLPSTSATSCVSDISKSAPRQPVKSHSFTQFLDCPALDPRYHTDHGNCTPGVDCYDCSDNWGLARVNQPAVPASTSYEYDYDPAHPGTPTVHVYMVDTGVDTGHSDFAGRISSGYNAAYLGDPLATGVEDCTGHGHGTHTSGIALGSRYGVAKDALLHPIKFMDVCDYSHQPEEPVCPHPDQDNDLCGSNSAAVVDAFDYIARTHAATYGPSPAVVNLSANLTAPDDAASQSAQNLIEDHDIQVIQSAGNNSDFGTGGDVCSRTPGYRGISR